MSMQLNSVKTNQNSSPYAVQIDKVISSLHSKCLCNNCTLWKYHPGSFREVPISSFLPRNHIVLKSVFMKLPVTELDVLVCLCGSSPWKVSFTNFLILIIILTSSKLKLHTGKVVSSEVLTKTFSDSLNNSKWTCNQIDY